MPFAFCLVLFGHQYLRVTYTDFEIRRTMGLPDRRQSEIDHPDSGWRASAVDRCLRTQVRGKTKFLRRAEVSGKNLHPEQKSLFLISGRWYVVDRLLKTKRSASGREPQDTPSLHNSFDHGSEMDRRGDQRRISEH